MKKYLLCLFAALLLCPLAAFAEGEALSVSPYIIDEQAKAGDILKYEIGIANNSDAKVNIYAFVVDVTKDEGDAQTATSSKSDKSVSVSRWLKFPRDHELMPGASTSFPLEIDVNSSAKPGKRFARISFGIGSNQDEAAGRIAAQLPINIDVLENAIEKAQMKEYAPFKTIFVAPPLGFNLKIENNGNKPLAPKGDIYVYNRRGEEVDDINVNPAAEQVSPGEEWDKKINWDGVKGFGKFKAKLAVEYGGENKRDLQDTVYFWYFPWKILAAVFSLTFLLMVIMVTLIFRRSYVHHQMEENARVQVRKAKVMSTKVVNLKK